RAGQRAPQDRCGYARHAAARGGPADQHGTPDDREPVPRPGPGEPLLHPPADGTAHRPAGGDGGQRRTGAVRAVTALRAVTAVRAVTRITSAPRDAPPLGSGSI